MRRELLNWPIDYGNSYLVRANARVGDALDWNTDDDARPIGYFQIFGVTAKSWDEACAIIEKYMLSDIAKSVEKFIDEGPPAQLEQYLYSIEDGLEVVSREIWFKSGYAFYHNDDEDETEGDEVDIISDAISREQADEMIDTGIINQVEEALDRSRGTENGEIYVSEKCLQILKSSDCALHIAAASRIGDIIAFGNIPYADRVNLYKITNQLPLSDEVRVHIDLIVLGSSEFFSHQKKT